MMQVFRSLKWRLSNDKTREALLVEMFVDSHRGTVTEDNADLNIEFEYGQKRVKIFLRKNSSDLKVFNQIFIKDEYRGLVDIVTDYLDPVTEKLTVVDLGANIGLTSAYMNCFFNYKKYIAIEPATDNFKLLLKNSSYDCFDAITAQQVAIWSSAVELSRVDHFRDNLDWSINYKEKGDDVSPGEKVNAITLTDLIELHQLDYIDILKIDIEGAEFKLFDQNQDIHWLSMVKFICVEIHPEFGDSKRIRDILKKEGFIVFRSGESTIGVNKKFF
jgi:FkbM family methyltransferase